MSREGLLREGTVKRIHVAQTVIRSNQATGEREPPLTVQTSAGPLRASSVVVHGSSRVVYSPDRPLSCGARVWVETYALVELEGSLAYPLLTEFE